MEKLLILFLQLYALFTTVNTITVFSMAVTHPDKVKINYLKFTSKEAALCALYWLGVYLWFFKL